MDSPILGSIVPMAFNFAPRGWMSCEGQLLNISQNAALFSLLGTAYGGNGTSTFALPDLRGRMIVGQGTMPGGSTYTVGQKAGTTSVTLLLSNLPAHTHAISVKTNSLDAGVSEPGNNFFGGGGQPIYSTSNDNTPMNQQAITASTAGSSLPVGIQNPYVAMYYNIATQGMFPMRN